MASEKLAPIGLKHQECERGRGGEKAPIRYVPDRDPVQEALYLKPESLKCTLADGSETRVTVWSGHGTNEQFVLHVNKAYSIAKKMGLISTCDDGKKAYDSKKKVSGRLFSANSPKTPSVKPRKRKRPQSHSP